MRPAFLYRLFPRTEIIVPDVSSAARTLGEAHRNRERNRIIDTTNEMRARMNLPPIPRRPA